MNAQRLAQLFKVLSADKRVRLLELLMKQTLCVGALSTRLKISQGAVSQHLRILRDAGLVRPERRGNRVHYLVDAEAFRKLASAVEVFLAGAASQSADQRKRKGVQSCVMKKRSVRNPKN